MKASEFKAKCLKLMDEVQKSGAEIVITKNGKPAPTLLGLHQGNVRILDEDIFSTGAPWNADR
jgi:prevent-host-death family protein